MRPFWRRRGGGADGDDLVECTLTRCDSCAASHKRPYRDGDVLFAESAACGCGGTLRIAMIFGEPADNDDNDNNNDDGKDPT